MEENKNKEIKITRFKEWPSAHWWNKSNRDDDRYVFRADIGVFSYPLKGYIRKREYLTFLCVKNIICQEETIALVYSNGIADIYCNDGCFAELIKKNVLNIHAKKILGIRDESMRYYVCLKLRISPKIVCQYQVFFKESHIYVNFLREFQNIPGAKKALIETLI